jgi:hypothetical protein
MASFGSGSARTAIWHPGSSIERPGFNQLSTSNYRLFGHSITSSSCVLSISTLSRNQLATERDMLRPQPACRVLAG